MERLNFWMVSKRFQIVLECAWRVFLQCFVCLFGIIAVVIVIFIVVVVAGIVVVIVRDDVENLHR